jgi:hypothetical protein
MLDNTAARALLGLECELLLCSDMNRTCKFKLPAYQSCYFTPCYFREDYASMLAHGSSATAKTVAAACVVLNRTECRSMLDTVHHPSGYKHLKVSSESRVTIQIPLIFQILTIHVMAFVWAGTLPAICLSSPTKCSLTQPNLSEN